MERIGVFLSANEPADPAWRTAAEELGTWLGEKGKTLVYGGVGSGLMEVLAQAARRSGAHVVGLIPSGSHWQKRESEAVQAEFVCADLADRKTTAVQESDILVALPGGLGTLDEVFSTLSGAIVGEHKKSVVLYNVAHCWDSLIAMLDDMKSRGLLRPGYERFLKIVDNLEALTALLDA